MLWRPIAAGLVAITVPAGAQSPPELVLICEGAMRGTFTDDSVGGMVADQDGDFAAGRASSSKYGEVPTTAEFQLTGSEARLSLPQPPTCGICVGEKGWRDVRDLEVDENRIMGRIRYGMFSGTKFEIDRRTGVMTSENGFRGDCTAQDLSEQKF